MQFGLVSQGQLFTSPVHKSPVVGIGGISPVVGVGVIHILHSGAHTWKFPVVLINQFASLIFRLHCLQGHSHVHIFVNENCMSVMLFRV